MRRGVYLTLALALAGTTPALYSQDQRVEIQKRLTSQFTLTKMTADASDIITAGSVLVLHKDGLTMCSTEAKAPPVNTYKNGAISVGFKAQVVWSAALGAANQQLTDIPQRKFVDGEKFWISAYSVHDDGVVLQFHSDPFGDVRYYGQLKFPFQKGKFPAADDVMKTIAEVVTVESTDQDAPAAENTGQDVPAAHAAAPPRQAPRSVPPVAAPTPSVPAAPPAAPVTISKGQTKDQVVGAFGQPQKIASLGTKEIYFYKDMKVTFVNGKVTDIQ